MLKVYVRTAENWTDEYEGRPMDYFDDVFEREWLKDEMVVRIIKEIDKTDVVRGNILESPVLGEISYRELSSGCKGLILQYFTNLKISGDRFGDNCFPIMLELAETKDIEIALSHLPKLKEPFQLEFIQSNKIVDNYYDYVTEFYRIRDLYTEEYSWMK